MKVKLEKETMVYFYVVYFTTVSIKSGEPWNVFLHDKYENIHKKITKRTREFYQNTSINNDYSQKRDYLEKLQIERLIFLNMA